MLQNKLDGHHRGTIGNIKASPTQRHLPIIVSTQMNLLIGSGSSADAYVGLSVSNVKKARTSERSSKRWMN